MAGSHKMRYTNRRLTLPYLYPCPPARGLGSAVSFLAVYGAEFRPQMHIGCTESPEIAPSGRKCPFLPVYRLDSVFGALLVLDSWGAIAPTARWLRLCCIVLLI